MIPVSKEKNDDCMNENSLDEYIHLQFTVK